MHPACRCAYPRHACRDIAPTLRLGEHLGARPPSGAAGGWPRAYAAHLLATLERQLIAPLCLSAETDLRLSNHASQALRSDKAEKPQAKVVHELMRLVALPPLAIFAVLLDRSGLTKADTQMVVVNKAEHQLPLAVVTLRGAAYAPPPGWLGSVSNPHETERAALAPAAKQAAQHAQLAAQYAQHLAAGRAHPSSWGLPPNAWSMAAAAGGVGLAVTVSVTVL